jgi:hypothetical protein
VNCASRKRTNQAQRSARLLDLKQQLFTPHGESNRQAAGFALEKILDELLTAYGLAPRASFRVIGDQIAGSFELDNETYLPEAKWKKNALSEADLLVFRGKVEGKSAYTRGVFVALNGITDEANDALTRGKHPTFLSSTGMTFPWCYQRRSVWSTSCDSEVDYSQKRVSWSFPINMPGMVPRSRLPRGA